MSCDSLTCNCDGSCERVGKKGCLSVAAEVKRDFAVSADVVSGLATSAEFKSGLTVSYHLTCCPSRGSEVNYLSVYPEVVWVTGEFHVVSNTDWAIE